MKLKDRKFQSLPENRRFDYSDAFTGEKRKARHRVVKIAINITKFRAFFLTKALNTGKNLSGKI